MIDFLLTRIRNYRSVIPAVVIIFTYSCNSSKTIESNLKTETGAFEISDFLPLSNFPTTVEKQVLLELDYVNTITDGFVLPSVRQSKNGYFVFSFQIRNKTNTNTRFAYKIYYQNESYKFPETGEDQKSMHPLCHENFYGSWEDPDAGFKTTSMVSAGDEFQTVTDSFRIVGNPRNEQRYFENGINNRWKRNPRVGDYSFLLIVTTESKLQKSPIPPSVENISRAENGIYQNPYYYFLHGKENTLEEFAGILIPNALKVIARPDLGDGIYINPVDFNKAEHGNFFHSGCNQDSAIYHHAAFEQFFNNVNESMRFENIPVVRDIMSDDYTQTDYNWDRAFYRKGEMISTLPGFSKRPCESVASDNALHKIVIKNPGTTEGVWRKESVGIRTRHGFTYGKHRMKCRLTELLNKNGVWNGLTNAIWLLAQQNSGAWNNRRPCEKNGFMESYWGGEDDKRVPVVSYSEIDFEILKTPPYCPSFQFPPLISNPVNNQLDRSKWDIPFSDELQAADGIITVACTNWDMACWQPADFKSGCSEIKYDDMVFNSHRWADNYRALTQKKYASDDELFASDFYYFEIEWRPTEIIWRVGPTPDKMQVVGYMNDRVTTIPNNQMTLIVTQEYHNTKWWPGSPFIQENIPFPSKDLVGEIYELVIE